MVPDTLAESVSLVPVAVPGSTWYSKTKLAVAPAAKLDAVHVEVPVLPAGGFVQLKPAGAITETKPVLAGGMLVRVTVPASSGPLFLRKSMKMTSEPAAGLPVSDRTTLIRIRSAAMCCGSET